MASTLGVGRLSPQDRKDLEKFTNFFILKSLQIIVQSRLGEKISTKSKSVSSGADWFNLAIKDTQDVQVEAKKTLSGQKSMLGQNVCAEISLRTTEGETMVLETWFIALDKNTIDTSVKVSYGVYNRMGVALKSLFSVSRIPPAYRLARRQGVNGGDYVICYRFYLGEPQYFQLGDGYQKSVVGVVPTPMGKITLNLAYRTKLLITPHKVAKDLPFELKDDHFKIENSPVKKQTEPKPCSMGFRRTSVSDDSRVDEMDRQDLCSTLFSTSPPDYAYINDYRVGSLKTTPPISIINKYNSSETTIDQRPQSAPEKSNSFTKLHRVGAFVQPKSLKDLPLSGLEEIPFLSLLNETNKNKPISGKDNPQNSSSSGENMEIANSSTGSELNKSSSSQTSATDDFVMVELKTPFAGVDSNNDLGRFYRDCQGALSLSMFEEGTTLNDTLDQVTTQLAMFETNMKDFDEFVDSFHSEMDP